MKKEEFLKECRNKAFNTYQLDIIQSAIDYGIEPEKVGIFAKIQYNENQMEQLLRALKENISKEVMTLLTNEDLNHYAMEEIINGYMEGLTLEEIKTITDPNISPQEIKKKRQILIEQKKGEETENLTVLMGILKSEMKVLKEGFSKMESQSEKLQTTMLLQKEQEFEESMQLVEAKELVIKNLQAVIRDKQEKIEQLTQNIKEQYQEIQTLLLERNESSSRLISNDLENKSKSNKSTDLKFIKEIDILDNQSLSIKQSFNKNKMFTLFQKKKTDLMRKILDKNLSAEQTKEIRLGIEDGLSEEQLIMMVDNTLAPEKLIEIRNTMKLLNDRKREGNNHV